jgi:hypothetical protein
MKLETLRGARVLKGHDAAFLMTKAAARALLPWQGDFTFFLRKTANMKKKVAF